MLSLKHFTDIQVFMCYGPLILLEVILPTLVMWKVIRPLTLYLQVCNLLCVFMKQFFKETIQSHGTEDS